MKPAAGERLLGGFFVLEIALHHDIAAEHDLAQRLAVGLDVFHGLGVHHRKPFERVIAHALADALVEPILGRKLVPGGMPLIQRGGTVGLGQAVEMGQLETASSILASTAAGGGAAAWLKARRWGNRRRSSSVALRSADMTKGAPERCVTLLSAMAS